MSNRLLRWAQTSIDDKILPRANPPLETHTARTKRMMGKMYTDAAEAGFTSAEAEEERERLAPQVLAAASDDTDFDVDAYVLTS